MSECEEIKNAKNDIKKIRALEDKYGLIIFRMGLTYLFDAGHSNFDDDYVQEGFKAILAEEEENKASGTNTIMTPDFKCEILLCSAELAQFTIWTLFAYIKKYVAVNV